MNTGLMHCINNAGPFTPWPVTVEHKVSAIVEVSLPQAAYYDIPQIDVKTVFFFNKTINLCHILVKIMHKILGL